MDWGCLLLAFGVFLLGGVLAAIGMGGQYTEYLLIGGLGGAFVCLFLQSTEF